MHRAQKMARATRNAAGIARYQDAKNRGQDSVDARINQDDDEFYRFRPVQDEADYVGSDKGSEELPTVPFFHGKVTFKSLANGEHRTFRVRRQASDADFAPGKTIVGVMTGPDNESSFTSFGFVSDDGTVRIWRKKDSPAMRWYADMVSAYLGGSTAEETRVAGAPDTDDEGTEETLVFPARDREYSIHASRACAICGRALTTPESVSRGIGPVCAGKF